MRSVGSMPAVRRGMGFLVESFVAARLLVGARPAWLLTLGFLVAFSLPVVPARGEITEQQERMAGNFSTAINNASTLFKEQKFTEAAAEVTRAQRILDNLSKKPSPEVLQKIGKDYRRLQKAHELLASKGMKLDPLKEITIPKVDPAARKSTEDGEEDAAAEDADSEEEKSKESRRSSARNRRAKDKEKKTTKADASKERASEERSDSSPVSFTQQVGPLLVQHCGKCHIDAKKGKYSLASFQTMMDTGSVIENDPDGSELLQKIESGEMPPSKGGSVTVPASDIAVIRSWIEQGARFDGDDPDESLSAKTK